MRISLSRNWLTSRVSEHSQCIGQASAFQNAKGKLSNDKIFLSFLMKYFYIHTKVLQGIIHSHRLPPTHHWCLVTSMPLGLLLDPSSSTKFEWFPITPKFNLLVAIFIPDMSDLSYISNQVWLVIESSIIVVITSRESLSNWNLVSSQTLPLYGEILLFTHSNH